MSAPRRVTAELTPATVDRIVAAFAAGWADPHPHAWDDLLSTDVALVQPLLRSGRGPRLLHDQIARLLYLIPDLTGDVRAWAASGNCVFIELELAGTVGGGELRWTVVDKLSVRDGEVTARCSFFDPLPLARTLAGRPRTWRRWWRSGIGPLLGRQRFVGRDLDRG